MGEIDIKFVGSDLRQCRDDALPDFNLSRRNRHLSFCREFEPCPEDVAAMVRFLCGPAARYINGQTIHANGGAYLGV
jgi:NAD(P)-dependent dehydrogenase (short-subunit alcohol dehydrogenase family)